MIKDQTLYSELIDRDFVFELAKRGMVSITSNQISVTVMKDKGGDLSGIKIPPHTHLEYLYLNSFADGKCVTLRFVCEKR